MPALSTLDTFTDTDGDALTTQHTPDYADLSWTTHASWGNAFNIYGNRARPAQGESVAYLSLAVPDRASENWGVEAPLYYAASQTGAYGGVWAGVTGAKTGYVVYWYGGDWALGKYVAGTWTAAPSGYSESWSVGTSKTVRMRFTSTQVIVSIDGVDRITWTDSSITPTRIGVYGSRVVTTADATGFHVSDITFVGPAVLNPARETDAAQALTFTPVGTISCSKYGIVSIAVGRLAGSPTLERSPDGSTWSSITAASHVDMGSGSSRTIVDRRPQYGSGAVGWGDTVHYRLTDGSNVLTFSVVADVDKDAVIAQRGASHHSYMAGSSVASQAGAYYPADTMVDMAVAYYTTGIAGYKTDVLNQFAYCQTLDNADNLIQFPAFTSEFYIDHHARTAYYALIAGLLLKWAGDPSDYLTVLAQVDTWAKAMIDKFSTRSVSLAGYQANSQTAWAAGANVAAGEIRRPTSANGRSYRALNAGTTHASTEPTWPTSTGGTVTDNGITWKETSYTGSIFYETYVRPAGSYLGSAGSVTINQYLEVAALYALLCTLPDSAFYTAGSYRTSALAIATAHIGVSLTMQNTDGSIPLGWGGVGTTYSTTLDTLYGGFVAQSMATIIKRLGSVVTGDGVYTDRLVTWLMGVYNVSEPINAHVVHKTSYDPESPQDPDGPFELLFPLNAARLRGISGGNLEKIALSGAFWDENTSRWGDYTVTGAIQHTADDGLSMLSGPYPALSQNTLDSIAIQLAVISRIDLAPAEEADTAPALSVVKRVTLTPATETSTPVALTVTKHAALTPATETDAAVALTLTTGPTEQTFTLTPATESDAAVALTVSKRRTLTPATEANAAVAVTATKRLTLTPATETDVAVSISYTGYVSSGPKPTIIHNTYVTSDQFGGRTVSSNTFGDRTTYIHPESTIS